MKGDRTMKITGDARKVLDTFIEYATRENNEGVADAMYYVPDELRRRARELKRQLEEMDREG